MVVQSPTRNSRQSGSSNNHHRGGTRARAVLLIRLPVFVLLITFYFHFFAISSISSLALRVLRQRVLQLVVVSVVAFVAEIVPIDEPSPGGFKCDRPNISTGATRITLLKKLTGCCSRRVRSPSHRTRSDDRTRHDSISYESIRVWPRRLNAKIAYFFFATASSPPPRYRKATPASGLKIFPQTESSTLSRPTSSTRAADTLSTASPTFRTLFPFPTGGIIWLRSIRNAPDTTFIPVLHVIASYTV